MFFLQVFLSACKRELGKTAIHRVAPAITNKCRVPGFCVSAISPVGPMSIRNTIPVAFGTG